MELREVMTPPAWPQPSCHGVEGLTHSYQGCTLPPLPALGRVPHGWRAAHGRSGSCFWIPASRRDLCTAPRRTTGRSRSPAAFLELEQAQGDLECMEEAQGQKGTQGGSGGQGSESAVRRCRQTHLLGNHDLT